MATGTTDRIEKSVLVKAPPERVWEAFTNVVELGAWFGAKLTGTVEPGALISGPVTHPGMEHITFRAVIESVEPPRLLTWRWHPGGTDPAADYSAEPTTLVSFRLEAVEEGTMVRMVESGFDGIPLERRAQAFEGNEQGWGMVLESIRQRMEDRG